MFKKLNSFNLNPLNLVLKGKAKEEALLYYKFKIQEIDAYTLEMKLHELYTPHDENHKLEIMFSHNKISDREYHHALIDLSIASDVEKKVKKLDYDSTNGYIDTNSYEKTKADILGEPYVKIISSGLKSSGTNSFGEIELDWNDAFIKYLSDNGYAAPTPEKSVDMWFVDLCRSVALENNVR